MASVIWWCITCFIVTPFVLCNSEKTDWSFPISLTTLKSEDIQSEKCKNDSRLYMEELKKFTLWAVEMFDASAKMPSGILYGATHALGSYDQCLKIGADGVAPVIGQYCLMRIQVTPNPNFTWHGDMGNETEIARKVYKYLSLPKSSPNGREPRVPDFGKDNPNQLAWIKIQRSVMDPSKRRRDVLHWALCVPASCDEADVTVHMQHELQTLRSTLGILTNVSMEHCEVKHTTPLSTAAIFMLSLLGVFVMIVAVSTTYDLFHTVKEGYKSSNWPGHTAGEVLLCFSLHRNLKRLVRDDGEDDYLKCMHGIKLYSMTMVILGHRLMFALGSPLQNPEFVEGYYQRLDTMILLNGFIIVDTFFTITGFLVCFMLLSAFQKNIRVPLPMIYFHRYLRLTPVYALVIGLYATILPYMGSGPIWSQKIGLEVKRCQENWWLNLLYVNNYVNSSNMCMLVSWYVACDFQLFLIAVPMVWLLHKNPRAGRMVLGGVIILSILIPFLVVLWKQLDALLLLYMNTLEDPISHQTFQIMYAPTHTRGSPYFIGMLFGYLTFLTKNQRLKVPQNLRRVCWLIASLLPWFSMLSAWIFYLPGRNYILLEAALYGSLHRVGWSLGISWIIFEVCIGTRGVVKMILGMKPVIALSRLTYCVFLTHGALQLYTVATIRVPQYASVYNLVWLTLGDILLAFIIGGSVCMIFESPILALEKILLRRKSKESSTTTGSSASESDVANVSQSSDEHPEVSIKTPRPRDRTPVELQPAFFRRLPPFHGSTRVAVISGAQVPDLKNGTEHIHL